MKLIRKYWFYLALVVLCLIPVIWFLGKDKSILINGLDTNFPLDPLIWFKRRFFVWNSSVNAGADFSSSTAGMFFHLIQVIPFVFGLSLRNVEIISFVFWFSAVVVSSYIFSKILLPKNKFAQLVLVALYCLNTYLFNTWENVKVSNLSLYISIPIFLSILHLLNEKSIALKKGFFFLVIASIFATGSGINPAYFSVIVLVIITYSLLAAITMRTEIKKILLNFCTVLAVLILVNLFWILPLLHLLLNGNTTTLSDLGFTDWLNSLSKDSSLVNIVRLQGAWDWYALDKFGMPQYLPYTLNYLYKLPFILFSFVTPALAFFSLIFLKRKKLTWYLFFGLLSLFGIFFGAGSHLPTGTVYIFLSQHVPFFSFFRSPWYIFTPILTISYASLVGLLIERVSIVKGKISFVLKSIIVLFLLAYCLYNYPLISGKIFRPGRNDGFYVKFPDYVFQAKDWLSKADPVSSGRIITYPDDQLESFNWGYRATDSILGLFSDKEIITPSFNIPSKVFDMLLTQYFNYLKKGEYQSAISILNIFGANTIFIKDDASTLAPSIGSGTEKYIKKINFGPWTFLSVPVKGDKIFSPVTVYTDLSNSNSFVGTVPLLGNGAITVNGISDTVVGKLRQNDLFLTVNEAVPDSKNGVGGNIKTYLVDVYKDASYSIALEKKFVSASFLKVVVDNQIIPGSEIKDEEAFIVIQGRYLTEGRHVVRIIFPPAPNLINVQDYRNLLETPSLRKEELPENLTKTLVAFNSEDKEKDITFLVPSFNPFLNYAIEMDYKYFYGSVPIVDIIQTTPSSPVKTLPLSIGSAMDWEHKTSFFEPVNTVSKLEVFLKLPPNKPGDRSKTYIENMSVKRVYDNRLFIVQEKAKETNFSPSISFLKKSPTYYQVKVQGNSDSYILAFLEGFSQDWEIKRVKGGEAVIVPHFSVNGYANGWQIPPGEVNQELVIYYKPQTLFLIGLSISLLVIISSLVVYIIAKNKK